MRILVIDVNFEYKNPMYKQFYMSLLGCMEVDFFGPGYVTRACLENGLCQFLGENSKYDAILLGTYFAYSSGEKGTRFDAYKVHRHTIPYYNVNDAYQCCGKILEELKKIDNIVKIFLYYEDFMSLPVGDKNMCKKLIDCNFYILSWPTEYMEEYSVKLMRQYSYLTNYAHKLAEEYAAYYVPIPLHGMGYNEIFVRSFSDRDYDWCIPGNRAKVYYPERAEVYKVLEERQKKIWADDPYQLLSVDTIRREHIEWYQFRNKSEKILSWMWGKDKRIASHPKIHYIAACREQYLESMRSSKLVYADGGAGNCFVRKYFEAGACGAVLVARKVPGMKEMGFIHEENCIIVEKYEDIVNIDKKYDNDQLEKMAQKGQKLILEKHMFVHRADSLSKTIMSIMNDEYNGAFWKDGNYIIK